MTNISGIIPKNPSAEPLMIVGKIDALSFIAEGENKVKTPILHMRISKTKGINLKSIEGTLKKYF